MTTLIKSLARDEEGATMVEYGVLVGLITAVSIGVIATIGTSVFNAFTAVQTALTGAGF